jgi:predicted nucleic acid-binding protein
VSDVVIDACVLLAYFEIAGGLTRAQVRDGLSKEDVVEAWKIVDGLGLVLHEPIDGERIVAIAVGLGRHSAYDAAYLALGERLGAEVWTLDGPLFDNAGSRGHRVRLIEPARRGGR